jgi:ubiquinone/menaquinone biosynthesis C-methylase UbiE
VPFQYEQELALAGMALARNWLGGSRAATETALAEIRRLASEPASEWREVPERSVGEGYRDWAATYDLPGNPLIELEESCVHALFARLPIGVVLDAACGTGRHAAELRRLSQQVIGVDASTAMLERARQRVPDADLRMGELTALPLGRAAVDAAVCALVLTHLPVLLPVLAELGRVVRPGGTIILSDIHPLQVEFGGQASYRGTSGTLAFVRNHLHSFADYLRSFRQAQLEVIDCHELGFGPTEIELWSRQLALPRAVIEAAVNGLPAILVWELRRPA